MDRKYNGQFSQIMLGFVLWYDDGENIERRGSIMGNGGSMISLDAIIEYVLDEESGETPKFVRDCERMIKHELLDYTQKNRQSDGDEVFVEENAGELLDSICKVNRTYMKMGMKLAAGMIFQLME